MARADFLARLGIFVSRGFLDASQCAMLRREIRSAGGAPAPIRRGAEAVVDEEVRRVRRSEVSQAARSLVVDRFRGLIPVLGRHFRVQLRRVEQPSFLRYGPGDFYVPHRDSVSDPEAPAEMQARQVSVVVFLNAHGEEESDGESYGGGALTFAGLLDAPRLGTIAIPLEPEAGLLVAFRSDVLHSVEPVTWGERYSVVGWFS